MCRKRGRSGAMTLFWCGWLLAGNWDGYLDRKAITMSWDMTYIYIYIVRWEGVYPVLSMSDFMGRTIILVLICSDRCIGFPWMMAPSMGLSAPCLGFTSFQLPKWCCHRLPIHATTHKSQTPCSPKDTCLLFCILFSGTDDCIYCV